MPNVKYFKVIEAAQKRDAFKPIGGLASFDFNSIAPTSFAGKVSNALFQKILGPAYALSRAFFPVAKVAGFYHVTRDAQVRDILTRPEEFNVPFGPEMKEIAGGVIFALGVDGVPQARQNALVRKLIRADEDIDFIKTLTGRFATALLENSGGKIDAINELFKRTATEVCARYFGLAIDDPDGFADWMMACSSLLFGDPYGAEKTRTLAMAGAARLRIALDDSVRRTKIRLQKLGRVGQADKTIVERLIGLQAAQAETDPISDDEIRAILFGMLTGFVPTNTLAAGKMLSELVARPQALASAIAAANEGVAGRERLTLILLEAGRLNPAISPGVWRYCPKDAMISIDGKVKTIPAGSLLLVSTMSAMRDKRAIPEPSRFWPERVDPAGRPIEPDLMFGEGTHWCLGKYLAIEQITEVFSALLRQKGIRPAKGKGGKLQSVGPFPRHLEMQFETPAATQSMFIVLARANLGVTKEAFDAQIAPLGNPAGDAMRSALDATGIVHFSSLSTIPHAQGVELAWELSVDGTQDDAITALATQCEALLRPIFAQCGLGPGEDFANFLKRHIVNLHGKPWGANGLNYNGLGEFPVASVAKQARFSGFVERVLNDFLSSEAKRGSHAMLALTYVRRIIDQDRILALSATPSQKALMQEAEQEGFDAYRLQPEGASLKLASFRPATKWGSFFAFLKSKESWIATLPFLAVFALFSWEFWTQTPSAGIVWSYIGTAVRALLATALVFSFLIAAFFLAIRRAEKKDWVNPGQASLDHIAAIGRIEDAPGYAQNHILAVGEIKPGMLRAFAHAFSLWAIRIIITFFYRPGFVINMGTIHYARWWRVPGTNKTAFYSNFNGSWESYLEDFITRARWGQTAVWSNWKGFPETKYLAFEGAGQGDNFKRWVRTVQQIVPFWYSRFPALTTDQIRNNALIHTGIARAKSNSEAEEWLRCFGSMPRVENLIESDEVQALVFSGLKRLPYSTCLILRLPEPGPLGEWLSWIRGETQQLDMANASGSASMTDGLMGSGILVPVYGRDGAIEGYSLANSLTLTFGDRPLVGDASVYDTPPIAIDMSDVADPQKLSQGDAARSARRAVFLGTSAKGIARFASPNVPKDTLLESFPPAFRMGMSQRGRNLGDHSEADAGKWRWSDDAAEAVLFIYAETPADLATSAQVHRALLENYGGRLLYQTDCAPADLARPDFEHFGYRDGISQPVIKGTGRATRGVPPRDMLEPGEFILGYKNGEGYFPPSPALPAEADMNRDLPILSDGDMGRFPDFGAKSIGIAPRDFGRNGSFVVIRELAQDVEGFDKFVADKADALRGALPGDPQTAYRDLYKVIGQYPDKEWVKAKLMGRWPSGRPLVGNPVNTPSAKPGDPDAAACMAAEIENDFAYGSDDPQGLACPFASHVRRANPRDSKQPGDPAEQIITNRHRLLRRGRTYVKQDANGKIEKGLMFVSLCADIERQFEFVQQVWANSSNFHGLTNEPDPIFGADTPDSVNGSTCPRNFTIPTPAGPIKLTGMQNFVSVKAGGYFFLPSRSALTWLTDVALSGSPSQ